LSREVQVSEQVIDQFPVFDVDGYTKVSGVTSFTERAWKDGVADGAAVDVSEIGTSGEYKVTFTPNAEGFWKVEVENDFNHEIWYAEYDVISGTTDDLYDMIRRALGLSHENVFIDNTVYDADSQQVSARVRIFDSKVNCMSATDGGIGEPGVIAEYTTTVEWEALDKYKTFRQVKD